MLKISSLGWLALFDSMNTKWTRSLHCHNEGEEDICFWSKELSIHVEFVPMVWTSFLAKFDSEGQAKDNHLIFKSGCWPQVWKLLHWIKHFLRSRQLTIHYFLLQAQQVWICPTKICLVVAAADWLWPHWSIKVFQLAPLIWWASHSLVAAYTGWILAVPEELVNIRPVWRHSCTQGWQR